MKLFKTIDYYVQACMIASAVAVNLFLWAVNDVNGFTIIVGYLLVGGWQVCSIIAHFMVPALFKVRRRKIYLVLLLITVVVCGIMWFGMREDDAILFAGGLLLVWSPILAIIYLTACYQELKLLKEPVAE